MDYIAEAKKFIQRAVNAQHPDVVKEQLKMADWCLGQEIEERDARRREDAGTRQVSH
jgi:hypothetical protein